MQEQPYVGEVLIVDDDAAIRAVLREIIEFGGYRVEVAVDGAQALAVLEHYRPQVILLDMRMPVMDGWTFARRLRDQGNTTPIVVMTAAPDAKAWAAEVQAQGVLAKPFDLVEVLAILAEHCATVA
jgi:two-component system chemotaxis response regulator CheY